MIEIQCDIVNLLPITSNWQVRMENTFIHLFDSFLRTSKRNVLIFSYWSENNNTTTQVLDVIMVIDQQTLVQIVLLLDIDHNDDGVHTYGCLSRGKC